MARLVEHLGSSGGRRRATSVGPHAFALQGRWGGWGVSRHVFPDWRSRAVLPRLAFGQPRLSCSLPRRKAWAEELVARRRRQQEQDGKGQAEQTEAGAAADVTAAAAASGGAEGAGADEAEQQAKRARVEG